jgi:choline dehydrogenase-like flavoprotein
MSGWPITAEDLSPHYRAVLNLMPFSARRDGLDEGFPLHHDGAGVLASSRQAAGFLHDLELNARALKAHGVTFGVARLALQAQADGKPGCVYCGKCLYGCPFEYIYNSSHTLQRLRKHPALTYHPGAVVERLQEIGSQVEVSGRTFGDGQAFRMRADKVFVACGVVSTARVMLTSQDAYEHPIHAVDNCYFLLPLIRYRGQRGATDEPLHTLAQAFIEVLDPAIGPQTTHLQVYTYNELFREEVARILGRVDRLVPAHLRRGMLGRLLLVQGYLHSDLSARITITLRRGIQDHPPQLEMAGEKNPRTLPALSALKRRLWSERALMRAVPVTAALRIGEPGRGFHTGGTFPMRVNPGPFEVDLLGRPHGFSNVHLVDSSVFPSLPATTITLSVMANAHRIGTAALA